MEAGWLTANEIRGRSLKTTWEKIAIMYARNSRGIVGDLMPLHRPQTSGPFRNRKEFTQLSAAPACVNT
jgi:hypothetical protein